MPYPDDVAALFGISPVAAPRRMPEAWSNDVYAVDADSGRYVLKVLPSAAAVNTSIEAAVLADGSVPMAEPVAAQLHDQDEFRQGFADKTHPDHETGTVWLAVLPDGRAARCHRWVEGVAASRVRPTAAYIRDVARSVAAIHRLATPVGDTGDLAPVDFARWRSAVRLARTFDWDLAASTPLVEAAADRLDTLRAARLPTAGSHRDLDPKNAVVRPDGRVALLDWDYAGPILLAGELVDAAMSFAGEEFLAIFVRSYVDAGGPVRDVPSLATAAQQADVDWLLRNVERCDSADPGERELGHRAAPQILAELAPGLDRMQRCTDKVASLLRETQRPTP